MVTRYRSCLLLCLALPTSACFLLRGADRRPSAAPHLPLTPCHLDGLAEEVQCGALEVYENRDAESGRRIRVQVAVLPAFVRDPEPDPFVVLAGGPGQGARSYASLVPRYFQRVRRTRDIVLVDLRGTGDSAPLKCPPRPGGLALQSFAESPKESALACLASLDGDPRLYTHHYAVADLHDVLQQLGYERLNLWGGSWGTRSALVFAATYPETVRTVVLDGAVAAGIDFPWSYGRDAQRVLTRLFEDCQRDPACDRAFPSARREVAAWLARLQRQPLLATVRHPRTAEQVTVRLDRTSATEVLRASLYSPLDSSRLLMVVHLAIAGDIGPLVATAERAAGWSLDTMALGQTMAVLCSEDVGRHAPPAVEKDTLFGTFAAVVWIERCSAWPKGRAPEIGPSTRLSTPALILSGDLDPVTPPARGEAMRDHFPNSLHVVAPGSGHNVSFSGCLPQLIEEFVRLGRWQSLNPSCAGETARPPFVTSLPGGES
jgi:pimeloyl-ACP methyl ester carboxylesterase